MIMINFFPIVRSRRRAYYYKAVIVFFLILVILWFTLEYVHYRLKSQINEANEKVKTLIKEKEKEKIKKKYMQSKHGLSCLSCPGTNNNVLSLLAVIANSFPNEAAAQKIAIHNGQIDICGIVTTTSTDFIKFSELSIPGYACKKISINDAKFFITLSKE